MTAHFDRNISLVIYLTQTFFLVFSHRPQIVVFSLLFPPTPMCQYLASSMISKSVHNSQMWQGQRFKQRKYHILFAPNRLIAPCVMFSTGFFSHTLIIVFRIAVRVWRCHGPWHITSAESTCKSFGALPQRFLTFSDSQTT